MEQPKPKLIEIRCPIVRPSKKDGKNYKCDKLAVKVTAGSAGEVFCHSCRKPFEFEVAS